MNESCYQVFLRVGNHPNGCRGCNAGNALRKSEGNEMTYKGSNWTRGVLGNIPDLNPLIDCSDCGESYGWQDYWHERYVEAEDKNAHEDEFVCDSCEKERKNHERRRNNNLQLTAYL